MPYSLFIVEVVADTFFIMLKGANTGKSENSEFSELIRLIKALDVRLRSMKINELYGTAQWRDSSGGEHFYPS